jgi:hypothetical protein
VDQSTATFHDHAGNLEFVFQPDPAQPSLADFSFAIWNVGIASGTVPVTSPTAGVYVLSQANACCQTLFEAVGSASPTGTGISMVGTVDTVHDAAAVTVVLFSQTYTLVDAMPSASAAPAAATAAALAMQQQNWNVLYSLLTFDEQHSSTETAFAQAMGQPGPAVTQIQLAGSGTEDVQPSGVYWHQPITITATDAGGSSRQYSATMDLLAEGDAWRVVDTSAPS